MKTKADQLTVYIDQKSKQLAEWLWKHARELALGNERLDSVKMVAAIAEDMARQMRKITNDLCDGSTKVIQKLENDVANRDVIITALKKTIDQSKQDIENQIERRASSSAAKKLWALRRENEELRSTLNAAKNKAEVLRIHTHPDLLP